MRTGRPYTAISVIRLAGASSKSTRQYSGPSRWASASICRAYSSSSLTRGLLGEKLADGVPYVVLRGEVAGAYRQAAAAQLGEDLGELRVARPESRDAAGLDVAGVVHLARDGG